MKKDNKNKVLSLLLLSIFVFLFSLNFISSKIGDTGEIQGLGTFRQGNSIRLVETCDNCTYVNITRVGYPNSTDAILGQYPMTKNGTQYNYTFTLTTTLGDYLYTSCGDLNNVLTCRDGKFTTTPSGQGGTANIVFFVFIIFALYALNLIAYRDGNTILTALSGMALIFLGVYMINQGLIVYRDNLTRYFSYVTIGWGFVSTMIALYSWIKEL